MEALWTAKVEFFFPNGSSDGDVVEADSRRELLKDVSAWLRSSDLSKMQSEGVKIVVTFLPKRGSA